MLGKQGSINYNQIIDFTSDWLYRLWPPNSASLLLYLLSIIQFDILSILCDTSVIFLSHQLSLLHHFLSNENFSISTYWDILDWSIMIDTNQNWSAFIFEYLPIWHPTSQLVHHPNTFCYFFSLYRTILITKYLLLQNSFWLHYELPSYIRNISSLCDPIVVSNHVTIWLLFLFQ